MSSSLSAQSPGRLSKNGVSTIPGSIRVTRIAVFSCIWRSSARSASPIAVAAHLVAE